MLILHMQLTTAAWHRLQETRGLLPQLVSPLHKAAPGRQGEKERAACRKACLAPGLPVADPGSVLRTPRCGFVRTAHLAAYWHDVFRWCHVGFEHENRNWQALTLPAVMQTLTPDEETCDPMTRNCQTPMHVWETKCTSCYGSGEASAHLSSSSAVPAHVVRLHACCNCCNLTNQCQFLCL